MTVGGSLRGLPWSIGDVVRSMGSKCSRDVPGAFSVSTRFRGPRLSTRLIRVCCEDCLCVCRSFCSIRPNPFSTRVSLFLFVKKTSDALAQRIRVFFDAAHGTYGYRRIHADLHSADVECSPELVRSIMREHELVPCQPRPFRTTTESGDDDGVPDLVKRDFAADRPGVKFVGDITYIHTWQGFVYLATVIDCFSRKVVGWSIADHMRTELVAAALNNAAATTLIEPGSVFHSDRGSVYTSRGYRALVAGLAMRSLMGRTGQCWDNSMAESFFAALKNECVYRTVYATKAQARQDIIRYIEGFYNPRRRHSALGYRAPNDVHYSYPQHVIAA